jgi:hypothetical protein
VLILAAGNRAAAKRAVVDGPIERGALPGLDAGGDEIAHDAIFAL